jgi:hypothetical protein
VYAINLALARRPAQIQIRNKLKLKVLQNPCVEGYIPFKVQSTSAVAVNNLSGVNCFGTESGSNTSTSTILFHRNRNNKMFSHCQVSLLSLSPPETTLHQPKHANANCSTARIGKNNTHNSQTTDTGLLVLASDALCNRKTG